MTMKTLLLASTLIATIGAATLPASAQFAGVTGDGIFGRDYRSEAPRRQTDADLAVGYTAEKAPETTGSIRAVTTRSDERNDAAGKPVEVRTGDDLRR